MASVTSRCRPVTVMCRSTFAVCMLSPWFGLKNSLPVALPGEDEGRISPKLILHLPRRIPTPGRRCRIPLISAIISESIMSHAEAFAKIKLAAQRVIYQKVPGAFTAHATLVDHISAIHDGKRLANIVIR